MVAFFSSRFTLGAYVAHIEAALSSCALLVGLLIEVQLLYQQAIMYTTKLEHKNKVISRRTASLIHMTRNRDDAERRARFAKDLAERMSGFLDITSHELRTPLTSMVGYLGLLERYLSPEKYGSPVTASPERLLELVKNCTTNAFLLNQIIADLSESTRPMGTPLVLIRHAEDITTVVSQVIESCTITFRHNHIIFTPPTDPLPPANIDNQRIFQVLYNLVKNATKFSPADKPITISAAAEQNAIRISVTDQGIGIPPSKLNQIWEKFVQLAPDEEKEGWGLGLFLCKTIVEAHGGTVGVASVERQGSTFWFTLPLSQSEPLGTEQAGTSQQTSVRAK